MKQLIWVTTKSFKIQVTLFKPKEVNNWLLMKSNSCFSFIGHSLGALIIRAALAKPAMHKYHDRLYTYLSLAGPHLGTGYQNSKLVSAGMWVFQKLKKSPAINQLSLKDEVILEKTFVFKTSAQRSMKSLKYELIHCNLLWLSFTRTEEN